MATWIAVLPDGRIQSPYESPLKNPDPGFIVGTKFWLPYGNTPIKFHIEGSGYNQDFLSHLYICCISKDAVTGRLILANSSNLNLNPLQPELRNINNDLQIFDNQSTVSSDFVIYREPHGTDWYIDAPGGTEVIIMSQIWGHGNFGIGGGVTYADKWFRYFSGDRLRNQVYLFDPFGSDWHTVAPSRDYHNSADNGLNAGCLRFAHRDLGNNVYEIRTEDGWSGEYHGWLTLTVEGLYVGDEPPTPPEESSSTPTGVPKPVPLIHVKNCSGLNLEITRMVLVGGFPTVLLGSSFGSRSNARVWNNIIVKDVTPPNETYQDTDGASTKWQDTDGATTIYQDGGV